METKETAVQGFLLMEPSSSDEAGLTFLHRNKHSPPLGKVDLSSNARLPTKVLEASAREEVSGFGDVAPGMEADVVVVLFFVSHLPCT